MNPLELTSRLSRLAAAFALGCLLAACGGGGGGGSVTPPVTTPAGASTSWAGPYVSADESYFALAVQDGQTLELRAVRYLNATSAIIYSGPLALGNEGAADVPSLKAMRADGSSRTGFASLTGVSAVAHSAVFTLNDASDSLQVSPVLSGSQRQPVDALSGTWTGTWVDGLVGSNTAIALSNVGGGISVNIQALGCSGVSIAFGPYLSQAGVYRTTIAYPNTTECSLRRGQSLTGWAWVRAVGAAQRLDLVAIDSQGSGVVFRADR